MRILDTRGEKCPIPVVRAAKWLKAASSGDALRVESTDPGSVPDFAAWARTDARVELVSQSELDERGTRVFVHVIRRA